MQCFSRARFTTALLGPFPGDDAADSRRRFVGGQQVLYDGILQSSHANSWHHCAVDCYAVDYRRLLCYDACYEY